MESIPPSSTFQEDSDSNRKLTLYIVGAIVMLCCCIATAVGGYYGYQAYVTAKQKVEEVKEVFEIPVNPDDPNSPVIPLPFTPLSVAPEGGLGDERARQFVWTQVFVYYEDAKCPDPQVDTTEITVVTQPDADGSWQEKWNVDCGDGTFHVFVVDFQTQDGYSSGLVQPPQ